MSRIAFVVGAVVFAGCSAGGGSRSLVVGRDGTGGARSGPPETGGTGIVGHLDAGTSKALEAHIERPAGMRVEFVTLSCAGDCADVLAVATGGAAPYDFTWEDGSAGAERRVCPLTTTRYELSVTDAGISTPEFRRPPETVKVPLPANVSDCTAPPDGGNGAGGAVAVDGCLGNPSFEGPVTTSQLAAFDAPPWDACYAGGFITYSAIGDPTLWPFQNWHFPTASDGKTYLALGQQGVLLGRTSQTPCAPIQAGATLSFTA